MVRRLLLILTVYDNIFMEYLQCVYFDWSYQQQPKRDMTCTFASLSLTQMDEDVESRLGNGIV